jgi:hypothetical protein
MGKTPDIRGFVTCESLDERLGGFDGALDDVACLVDGVSDMAASALDGFFGFLAETLSLLLEVVGCVLEIVAGVLDSLAELLARLGSSLRCVKKRDRGSCCDSNAEGQPVTFLTHFELTSCFLRLYPFRFSPVGIGWIRVCRGYLAKKAGPREFTADLSRRNRDTRDKG